MSISSKHLANLPGRMGRWSAGHRKIAIFSGLGMGLATMKERAARWGGTLEAGPAPGGGFRVRATFPRLFTLTRPDDGPEDTR